MTTSVSPSKPLKLSVPIRHLETTSATHPLPSVGYVSIEVPLQATSNDIYDATEEAVVAMFGGCLALDIDWNSEDLFGYKNPDTFSYQVFSPQVEWLGCVVESNEPLSNDEAIALAHQEGDWDSVNWEEYRDGLEEYVE